MLPVTAPSASPHATIHVAQISLSLTNHFCKIDNEDPECSNYYDLGTVSCDFISNVINFEKLDKQLLFIKNIFGQKVNNLNSNNPYIYFYDDGSFEKKIIFTQ